MTEKMFIAKGGKSMTVKEQLKEYIELIPEQEAEKLLQYIQENYEVVKTEVDEEIFKRGRTEIKNGEYRML
ncbi:hypothetical protein HMPREF0322_04259 [Desulfitobacterium hafniense DP7]|uniref:Uncharacterized protein n=2 Tax=Desulfitobacterium hafniense TaxID=49338 RepID=G9XTF2_DESHA|nr:hypothetical protein HMPREF0322_04259 [Desulfitobacterium hafniense DP7]